MRTIVQLLSLKTKKIREKRELIDLETAEGNENALTVAPSNLKEIIPRGT